MAAKRFLGKVASRLCRYPVGKNFIEIALSRSVSEINLYLRLTQKFKMATKSGGKRFLGRVVSRLCRHPVGQKFRRNRSITLRFRDFLRFTQKFKMVAKSGGKMFFCKKSPVDSGDTLWVKNFVEISLSCSVSKINAFFLFYANSRWRPKVAVK